MPLLVLIALLALPFLEIWVMILVGQQITAAWTVAALFAASVAGLLVLRRAGTRVFRDFDAVVRTGTPPRDGVLDPLMLMVGGILLVIPGFITGALGLLIALPITRPALRWIFVAWAARRMERMRAAGAETVYVTVDERHLRGYGPGGGAESQERDNGGTVPPQVVRGRIVDDGDDT